jgi:UDP-galactopyranose mutase
MDADDEIVSTTPHTKRTSGYRDRVAEKINRLLDCSYSDCDGEKRVAIGDYGPYFFCTDDTCDYTESIDM